MLSPSMYSPPRSLHDSTQIFHYWKQCCRSSSDSLFLRSVAFAFTASTDSNLLPFNADLIFGNKKSHMGLGQVSTVDDPTRWSWASSKTSWQGVVRRCVVLVNNPWAVLSHFRSSSSSSSSSLSPSFSSPSPPSSSSSFSSSHPFTKVCQNLLVVDLVNGLTFRHPIHVNNPSKVKKRKDHNCLKFGFDMLCFLLPWWTVALPAHGLALTFWVVLKKPWFITS